MAQVPRPAEDPPDRQPLSILVRLILPVWLIAAACRAGADRDWVRFSTPTEGEATRIVGENLHPWAPFHVQVTFSQLENLRTSVPLPARVVIPPGSRTTILTLTPADPLKGHRMAVSYLYAKGDPAAVHDPVAVYLFPWEHGIKRRLDQGYFGPTTHRNLRALDFAMPEGTKICAARAGVVIGVKQDERRGGPGREYAFRANAIDILHDDGTWANYAHLVYRGARVRVGDRVTAGQVIGLSGKTGQASGPHLHFSVNRAVWEGEGSETIPTVFTHLDAAPVPPEEGQRYYAVHPGGRPFEAKLGDRLTDADYEPRTAPVALTNKVKLRPETVDDRIFFFCANGAAAAQAITVDFDALRGYAPSKPLPFTRVVPGRTEVFMLSLTPTGESRMTYRVRMSAKSVPAP